MSWIWLNESRHKEYQKNFVNVNFVPSEEQKKYNFCVAVFTKKFHFDKQIKRIKLRVSADSTYRLFLNGEFKAIGPASPGGDFVCRRVYPYHFADLSEYEVNGNEFEIKALVKSLPAVLTEYSKGHCGFFCDVIFIDDEGKEYSEETDSTWSAFRHTAYKSIDEFDLQKGSFTEEKADETEDIWHLRDSLIPSLSLNSVYKRTISLKPLESKTEEIVLDKIYGIIPLIKSDGSVAVKLTTREMQGQEEDTETVGFMQAGEYCSFRMYSAGEGTLVIENLSESSVNVEINFIAPWYPIKEEGSFRCSDADLNKVYDVCKHTLKICRQSIHLDSTKHQEHLACTGDYYIESLMTLFCFDDMRLAEFDLKRTADWLCDNNGRMFHTTYSLIFVQMLLDVYMITGHKELLTYCSGALTKLFNAFSGYMGESGVIENPPDYMFVDWTVVDGYSMHHPPKALGQTVLNAFYYKALTCCVKIYGYLGETEKAEEFRKKAKEFRFCFNREFYDSEKKLYFDGKNDKHGSHEWLPENSGKRYYTKYPNILACAYGLCEGEEAKELLERVIFNPDMQDIQPYFTHYLLTAVKETGLVDKYAMKIFDRWKAVVKDCDKGLAEGWIAPQPDYKFDHSHAWGGTVAYHMPLFISGLKILEPGMTKIETEKNLLGLDYAEVSFVTPKGRVTV